LRGHHGLGEQRVDEVRCVAGVVREGGPITRLEIE
jgi:hypothetical protein